MGKMAGIPSFLGMILVLIASEQFKTVQSLWCENQDRNITEKLNYCGLYQDEIIYNLYYPVNDKPPLAGKTAMERLLFLETAQDEYRSDPDLLFDHEMCTYAKTEMVRGCCTGYEGEDCEIPICNPACGEHGSCEEPDYCECDEPYVGIDCKDDYSLVTDTEAYCYATEGCSGEKQPGFEDRVVTKEECVDDMGKSWGVDTTVDGVRRCENVKYQDSQVVEQFFDLDFRTCINDGQYLYRTFDGQYFNFCGTCKYVLVAVENEFHVTLDVVDCETTNQCKKRVTIDFPSGNPVSKIELFLTSVKVNDVPIAVSMIPVSASPGSDITLAVSGDFILVDSKSKDFSLKYDRRDSVSVTLDKDLYSDRTEGLCGVLNNDATDDYYMPDGEQAVSAEHFGNSWVIPESGVSCPAASVVPEQCDADERDDAEAACGPIHSFKFRQCARRVDSYKYFEMCVNQYCGADNDEDREFVVCKAVEAYSRACTQINIIVPWRSGDFCPKTCQDPSMVYSDCVSKCPATCATIFENHPADHCLDNCLPGCHCPLGSYFQDGKCVAPTECTCEHLGSTYNHDETMMLLCNKCTCNMGTWTCTRDKCASRCSVQGLGHVVTFDGLDYSFVAVDGTYTLVEPVAGEAENDARADMSIEATYGPCTQDIMDLAGDHRCMKSLDVYAGQTHIRVTSEFSVFLDEQDMTNSLPLTTSGARVTKATSDFLIISVFGIGIHFSPYTMLYITVLPFFEGKIRGLCGTYNSRDSDDMLTRMGMPEIRAENFAAAYCSPSGPQAICEADEPVDCQHFGVQFETAVMHCRFIWTMTNSRNVIKPSTQRPIMIIAYSIVANEQAPTVTTVPYVTKS
ncbi:hypothetical protein ScPMuIL_015996 [Solemya velum]